MVDKATCENASSDITFEMFGMVELKGKGAVALYELQVSQNAPTLAYTCAPHTRAPLCSQVVFSTSCVWLTLCRA